MSIIIKDSIDYSRTCFNIYVGSQNLISTSISMFIYFIGQSAHPFVNNVYKAAQLARDMLAHVYILLIFPLCISTKNLYEKYNIIDTDALPPLQKYSRGNLKIYSADTENCISYLYIKEGRDTFSVLYQMKNIYCLR